MTTTAIRRFVNGTYTGPPVWCAVGKEKIACVVTRPETGGPVCLVHFVAGDGRELLPSGPVDMRLERNPDGSPLDFEEAFAATPFVSDFDQTLKAFVNYKRPGGGNDRELAVIATGHVPTVTR